MEIQKAVINIIVNDADKFSLEITQDKKIMITCAEHRNIKQLINNVAERVCRECRRLNMFSNTEAFIAKAIVIHRGKFSYGNVKYVNNATKVSITCRKHGDFLQNPSNHLTGQGCRICSNLERVIPLKDFLERVTLKHGENTLIIMLFMLAVKIK